MASSLRGHQSPSSWHWAIASLERTAAQSLTFLNALALVFIIGPIVTPLVFAAGATGVAGVLYRFFHLLCHQWAFRTFFILGPQATFSRDELNALGVDPYTFMGDAQTGWKMAFCERNLAISAGLLAFGLAYAAARRQLRAANFPEFALLVAPMALDGLTQLVGWRESTWELRVATGLLFGLASGWFLYPRFAAERRAKTAYV